MKKLLLVLIALLCGCASSSGVLPLTSNTFTITREGGSFVNGLSSLKREAFKEADEFCARGDKHAQVTKSTDTPAGFARFPRVDLEFTCEERSPTGQLSVKSGPTYAPPEPKRQIAGQSSSAGEPAELPSPDPSPSPQATKAEAAGAQPQKVSAEIAPTLGHDSVEETYVAITLGDAIFTSASRFIYGARLGVRIAGDPSGMLVLGLSVNSVSAHESLAGISVGETATPILAELLCRRAFGTGFYVGGRFGVGLVTIEATDGLLSASASRIAFTSSAVLGVEIPLASHVAMPIEFSYLTIGGGTYIAGGSVVSENSMSAAVFQGGVLFHW